MRYLQSRDLFQQDTSYFGQADQQHQHDIASFASDLMAGAKFAVSIASVTFADLSALGGKNRQ